MIYINLDLVFFKIKGPRYSNPCQLHLAEFIVT